ncbi:MAG: hypothetical protein HC841_08800, partial [Verrucomicrobiae bacterium]|nr:hypothetical protein [Verrucomicrobiae bacterium]
MALLVLTGFFAVRSRAVGMASALPAHRRQVHSLPLYHGLLASTLVLVSMLAIYAIGAPLVSNYAHTAAMSSVPAELKVDALTSGATFRDIQNAASGEFTSPPVAIKTAADAYVQAQTIGNYGIFGLGIVAALAGLAFSWSSVNPDFRARNTFERFVFVFLAACATVAVLTTIGIVASVLYETLRFFFDPALKGRPTVTDFLFGTEWNPQAAMRADQGGNQDSVWNLSLFLYRNAADHLHRHVRGGSARSDGQR